MIPRRISKFLLKARIVVIVIFSINILAIYIPKDMSYFQTKTVSDNKTYKHLSSKPIMSPPIELMPGTRSNVIVNSYMRGGSSFVGRLFGFHPDSFYVYEPLWKYSIWSFYQKKNKCDAHSCKCGNAKIADDMVGKLISMNSCTDLKAVISPRMTDFYSGNKWNNFTRCYCNTSDPLKCKTRTIMAPKPCNDLINKQCLQQKHTVSKVLRLTVDMFIDILAKTNDTKVLHLFRDPRATMNSRITTDWFPVKTKKEIINNAECLCKRMLRDYELGLMLQASHPSRFQFVFYEDLIDDLEIKMNILYKFAHMRGIEMIGMDTFNDIANYGYKTDHALRDNSTDYKSWWRTTMDWDVVQGIDSVCSQVYEKLGYRKFDSESDFRDKSQTSFTLKSKHNLY